MSNESNNNDSTTNENGNEDDSDVDLQDVLNRVDKFIEEAYRDLNICSSNKTVRLGELQSQLGIVEPSSSSSILITSFSDKVTASKNSTSNAVTLTVKHVRGEIDKNLRSSTSEIQAIPPVATCIPSNTAIAQAANINNRSRRQGRKRGANTNSTNMQRPCEVIDLSVTPPLLPESIIIDDTPSVSAESNEIVDLCTPAHETSQRRYIPRQQLTRRRFFMPSPESIVAPSREVSTTTQQQRQHQTVLPTISTSPNTETADAPSDGSNQAICPICMDFLFKREPTTTRCGHVFCQICIRQAIQINRQCPICKARVNLKNLLRIYL